MSRSTDSTESTPADRARTERLAQGLPPVVKDPKVLARVSAVTR